MVGKFGYAVIMVERCIQTYYFSTHGTALGSFVDCDLLFEDVADDVDPFKNASITSTFHITFTDLLCNCVTVVSTVVSLVVWLYHSELYRLSRVFPRF